MLIRLTSVILLLSALTAHAAKTVDIPYDTADPQQKLDVYTPENAKNAPVVLWIHGGGWQTGDKAQVDHKVKACFDRGYVFVSINYRLLPGVDMLTLHKDVAKAIGWTHKHIAEYGGDPERLIITGHSAGAQLAAIMCTDERYVQAEGVTLKSFRGCIPVDGDTYDIPMRIAAGVAERKRLGKPEPKAGHREKFGGTDALHKEFSAVNHITTGKNIPPFLILCVAEHVDTSSQAYRLNEALLAANVPTSVFGARDTDHVKLNRTLGQPDDPATKAMFEFIDSAVKN
jgi:acetyl esterase/lipase